MDSAAKPICMHFHIFKNAGTSVDWALKKNFGNDAITLDDGVKRNTIIPIETVLAHLSKYPNAKSLSSHQTRPPLPKSSDYNFISLIFIRHPIDRIFSIYNYYLRIERSDGEAGQAKRKSPRAFFIWSTRPQNTTMRNFQTRHIGRQDRTVDLDEDDFLNATRNLESCNVVGIVDRLDESLVLAEKVLAPFFPAIDLAYMRKNVSQGRADTLDARLHEAESLIRDDLMQDLVDNNTLDLKLYKFANEKLDQRISTIPDFAEKLAGFKKRCNVLADEGQLQVERKKKRLAAKQ